MRGEKPPRLKDKLLPRELLSLKLVAIILSIYEIGSQMEFSFTEVVIPKKDEAL